MPRKFAFATPEDWARFNACVTTRETEPKDMNGGLGPCWLFYPPRGQNRPYPQFKFRGGVESAHLFVLEQSLGRLLHQGMEADHLCHDSSCTMRNACLHRRCARRSHLKEVPIKKNNAPDRKVASRVAVQPSDATPQKAPLTLVQKRLAWLKADKEAHDILSKEQAEEYEKERVASVTTSERLAKRYPGRRPESELRERDTIYGSHLTKALARAASLPSSLHDPRQPGDWKDVECPRQGCENSPFKLVLVRLPEDWVQADIHDGRYVPHSHRLHPFYSEKEERVSLWELKKRLLQRVKP